MNSCKVGAMVAVLAAAAVLQAGTEPLDSIHDIVGGTSINFEQPGNYVNDILPAYDILAEPNRPVTTFVYWVVGNYDAPISNRAGFSQPVLLYTTGEPWDHIGMTMIGSLLWEDRIFTVNAYGQYGELLGSDTRLFDPGSSQPEYNAAALFMGFSSTTPIYSFEMLSDNGNVGWDYLTFHTFSEPDTRADMNCDGVIDAFDIDPFVLALTDPAGYAAAYPNCDIYNGDINGDGLIDAFDIDPFVECITTGQCP